MSDRIVEEIVIFLVIGAVVVAVIWQIGASRRAKAALARNTEYQTIAERAIAAQETTEGTLTEVTSQLADMNQRVDAIERILKDAE